MGKNEQNCGYGMSVPQRYTDVSAHHWLVVLFGLGVWGCGCCFPVIFQLHPFDELVFFQSDLQVLSC